MIQKSFTILFVVFVFFVVQNTFAQEKTADKIENYEKAQLIHTSPYENSEIASAHIDVLRNAMRESVNSKGVFIFYCGKICSYGEIEAHIRGLNASLAGKGWKSSEYSIIHGGYRESLEIEYWLVPENACLPIPKSRIDFKDVKFKGTFKRKIVAYDCCE